VAARADARVLVTPQLPLNVPFASPLPLARVLPKLTTNRLDARRNWAREGWNLKGETTFRISKLQGAMSMGSAQKPSAAAKFDDFSSMPLDQLWVLHEQICAELSQKLMQERARIEQRLSELDREMGGHRRRYPRVSPKFRNPTQPAETWAGRGKCPRWLAEQLRLGKKIDDFRIEPPSGHAQHH
jgi:DNA-binding protein H-NS